MRLRTTWNRRAGLLGALVMVSLCVALLAGCGAESSTPDTGGTEPEIATQVSLAAPIEDWDPASAAAYTYALANIYETLLKYEPASDSFTPVLATDYSKSDDGLTWTFHIREGVKFHDGTELNAEAVKFSIDRTIELGKGLAYIWAAVKEIETPDPYTVVFHLNYPSPVDLISASNYAAYIVSPTAVKSHPDDWLAAGNEAGTGAYKLKSFKMGSQVVLEKFPDYWQGWDGRHFDVVVIKRVIEASNRRLLLEKGEADFTEELTPEDIEALKGNPKVREVVGQSFENLALHLNTLKPPLDNVLVRQALSYAFPYSDAVTYAAGGFATQSRGFVPKGMWGYDESLLQYTFDLDKAKELLTQAGFPNGGFELVMAYTSGDEAEKRIAELYKEELAKLGIDLQIRGMPWEGQWALAKSTDPLERQDIYAMYWWPDVVSPASFIWSLLHSEETPSNNLSYYSSPEMDKLIEEASAMVGVDQSKSASLFSEIQATAMEDAPVICVYDRQYVFATSSSFAGYEINPAYIRNVYFYDTYRE